MIISSLNGLLYENVLFWFFEYYVIVHFDVNVHYYVIGHFDVFLKSTTQNREAILFKVLKLQNYRGIINYVILLNYVTGPFHGFF